MLKRNHVSRTPKVFQGTHTARTYLKGVQGMTLHLFKPYFLCKRLHLYWKRDKDWFPRIGASPIFTPIRPQNLFQLFSLYMAISTKKKQNFAKKSIEIITPVAKQTNKQEARSLILVRKRLVKLGSGTQTRGVGMWYPLLTYDIILNCCSWES